MVCTNLWGSKRQPWHWFFETDSAIKWNLGGSSEQVCFPIQPKQPMKKTKPNNMMQNNCETNKFGANWRVNKTNWNLAKRIEYENFTVETGKFPKIKKQKEKPTKTSKNPQKCNISKNDAGQVCGMFGTSPGRLQDTSGRSPGHLRDISGTSPGHLRDNSGTNLKISEFHAKNDVPFGFFPLWGRKRNFWVFCRTLSALLSLFGRFCATKKIAKYQTHWAVPFHPCRANVC